MKKAIVIISILIGVAVAIIGCLPIRDSKREPFEATFALTSGARFEEYHAYTHMAENMGVIFLCTTDETTAAMLNYYGGPEIIFDMYGVLLTTDFYPPETRPCVELEKEYEEASAFKVYEFDDITTIQLVPPMAEE